MSEAPVSPEYPMPLADKIRTGFILSASADLLFFGLHVSLPTARQSLTVLQLQERPKYECLPEVPPLLEKRIRSGKDWPAAAPGETQGPSPIGRDARTFPQKKHQNCKGLAGGSPLPESMPGGQVPVHKGLKISVSFSNCWGSGPSARTCQKGELCLLPWL